MVVVSAVGMAALEPGLTVADFEALRKSMLDEQIEDPVDACPPGWAPKRAQSSSISTALSAQGLDASSSMTRSRAPPRFSPACESTVWTCSLHSVVAIEDRG
jgi:hypothetical protein